MTLEAKSTGSTSAMVPATSGFWNLPNALTVLRIFLVPLLMVFLMTRYIWAGLVVFLAASFTDWLDGHLARKRRQVTTLGQLLDPLADKLLIAAAFISLVELGLAPAWMVAVILGREFAVTGLRTVAASRKVIMPAGTLGKYKLAFQVVAVSLLIVSSRVAQLRTLGELTLWLVVVLAVVSATQYFREFWTRTGDSEA